MELEPKPIHEVSCCQSEKLNTHEITVFANINITMFYAEKNENLLPRIIHTRTHITHRNGIVVCKTVRVYNILY